MFALNPRFTLLAAQCMLSLVAFPSGVNAIAVRSVHSDRYEFSGNSHPRRRHSLSPAPRGKDHPSDARVSSSMQEVSREHKPHGESHSQQFFQTRDSLVSGLLDGIVDPLLKSVDTTVKALLGNDALGPILVGRHRDQYYYDRDKEFMHDDHPSRIYINDRSVRHTHRSSKRDQQGVPGSVGIMQGPRRIASLFLQPGDDGYELNASKVNSTTVYLVKQVPVVGSVLALDPVGNAVQLQVPVFNAQSAALQPYCATFDPNPPAPSQMTAEPCFSPSQASEHKSQLFTYNANSGSLQPLHPAAVENPRTSDALAPAANAKSVNADEDNLAEGDAVWMRGRDLDNPIDGVNLVFVPELPLAVEDYSSPSETSSITTVTVTETTTQADPSLTVAEGGTSVPTSTTSTTDAPESTASSASQSPGIFGVDVALPSTASSSISPDASTKSDNLSSSKPSPTADPDAIAASIASSDTSTSEAPSQPTPASLLVQITRSMGTSAPASASSV